MKKIIIAIIMVIFASSAMAKPLYCKSHIVLKNGQQLNTFFFFYNPFNENNNQKLPNPAVLFPPGTLPVQFESSLAEYASKITKNGWVVNYNVINVYAEGRIWHVYLNSKLVTEYTPNKNAPTYGTYNLVGKISSPVCQS